MRYDNESESGNIMKKFLKSICCATFISIILLTRIACAQADEFRMWQNDFEKQALSDGISQQTLNKFMPKMQLLPHLIETDLKKPEYLRNFWDYIQSRLTVEKVEKAKQYKHKYSTWLKRVAEKYHIPPEYLLALWSMETDLGSFVGKTPLISSLGTLAYHPRRRNFFTKELLAYFHILESEPYPPQYGSWDGGFGHFQFMPTTFVAYAVDADSNGTKSLTGSIPDSLASAANYLHKMGWHGDEPWGHEVKLPENFDWSLMGQDKSVSEWEMLGIKRKDNAQFSESEEKILATLRIPMGMDGPAFLTYPNFKLINRWNKLELYALTTGILSDMIANRRQMPMRPVDFRPLRTQEFLRLQQILADMGYYGGAIDGMLGPNMRKAIRMFQRDNKMITDGYPNGEVLTKLNIYNKELK